MKLVNILKQKKLQNVNQSMVFEHRIERIEDLTKVLTNTLEIYSSILQSKTIDDLDNYVEQETSLIIEQFQKLVIKAKTEKLENEQDRLDKENSRQNKTDNVLGGLIDDLSEKSHNLEKELKQNEFMKQDQTDIETLKKKNDSLINSVGDWYVKNKLGDQTGFYEDEKLLDDFSSLLFGCFAVGLLCYILNLPTFFGFVLAGIVLSTNDLIFNIIQIETLSRGLGIIFIMFFLGLEFNIQKLKKVWSISLVGSLILLLSTIALTVLIGMYFKNGYLPSIIIGECLFLSSTVIVLSFLKQNEMDRVYARNIVGILVAQDIMLGLLIAILPVLQKNQDIMISILKLLGLLFVFLGVCYLIKTPIIQLLTFNKKNYTLFMLSSISTCLLLIKLGEFFNQSVELSCFVCGVIIASSPKLSHEVQQSLQPIHSFFSSLFFASIGLHIYPSFLYSEGLLLLLLTLLILALKIFIVFFVMYFVFRLSTKNSFLIGIGLGQISEFTFVLASKAKSSNVLSSEVYFLLLGITTISMIFSPFLWSVCKRMGMMDEVQFGEISDHLVVDFQDKSD
ncbi:Transmembrane and coiled-coil domains-containing protein 3 [Terramyces sp. JEL0728]|nr:Transmembrane and coiled-coil domains-containing protein 3 [Terramyces sp. JEL0728]